MARKKHNILKVAAFFALVVQPAFAQQPADVSLPSLPILPVSAPEKPAAPNPVEEKKLAGAPLPAGGAEASAPKGELPVVPGAKPDVAAPVTAADNAGTQKQYSYGKSTVSIMFLPEKMEKLKEGLRFFEDGKPGLANPLPVEAEPAPQAPLIQEPDNYPVFHLSSIVFHNPSDWSLWLEGHKITSKKNNTDVQVIAVSQQGATFAWKPIYSDAIRQRKSANMFVSTDGVKNKLAAAQNIQYDADSGLITFQLKQNQSFSVAYFSIFEGYMGPATLPPLASPAAGNEITMGATTPAAVKPARGMRANVAPQKKPPAGAAPQPSPGNLKQQLDAYKDIDGIAKELSTGSN